MGKDWNPRDLPKLEGKIAVITGANAGIGLQTFKHIASAGAKVYFTARSEEKAKRAKEFVMSKCPNASAENLIWLCLDLSDVKSVVQAAEELRAKEQKIDILINNAGLVSNRLQTNDAGWEIVMAVCHIGHFVLTNRLIPLLKNAAAAKDSDVRVITVSSTATKLFIPSTYKIDFTSPSVLYGDIPYEPWKMRYFHKHLFNIDMLRFALSKLANMMCARELQRRFDELDLPILSLSVHPGEVDSDGGALEMYIRPIRPAIRRMLMNDDEGSFNTVFAATAKEPRSKQDVYTGKYLEPIGQVASFHPIAKNDEQCRALWEVTTAEANKYLQNRGYELLLDW